MTVLTGADRPLLGDQEEPISHNGFWTPCEALKDGTH